VNAAIRKSRAIHWGLRVSLALAALFCATAADARGPGGRISPYGSFLAAADLDGDRRPDVATAGSSRRDSTGYALDITIRLSSLQTDAITVRTAQMAGRFFLRDLDGDSDRDLIVESFDHEPLAVMLNDGGGHFHAANVDDYRAKLQRPESRSIETPPLESDSREIFETFDAPAVRLARSGSAPTPTAAPAVVTADNCAVVLRHSASASRGPPASL